MRKAREDRVRFRRGRQLDVVKSVWSNKKEVNLLCFYCVNNTNKRTTSRIPTWSPTVVLTGPGNAWLRWADGKRYSHCCMVVPAYKNHLRYTHSSYIAISISILPCIHTRTHLEHSCYVVQYYPSIWSTYTAISIHGGTIFAIVQ